MFRLPFENELKSSKRILLAGCGGGFDIFSGLPIYHNLTTNNKTVFMANFSFSGLKMVDSTTKKLCDCCWEVTHKTDSKPICSYFPEKYLCDYFAEKKQQNISIYCFDIESGVVPLRKAYETIVKQLNIDTIILCDGGTDSLMIGNEERLGTPTEDSTSLAAVHSIQCDRPLTKLLVCIGFGIDTFHGVSHYHFLENTAAIIKKNGFLGSFSLLPQMEEFTFFKEATEFVFQRMPYDKSIVNSSIIDATLGNFGDYHSTERTNGSKLFINPLMSQYWCYRLPHIVEANLYIPKLQNTNTRLEVQKEIAAFRKAITSFRKPQPLPV